MRRVIFGFLGLILLGGWAFPQARQGSRLDEWRRQRIRAAEERRRQIEDARRRMPVVPQPKPAVMNVDVRIVVTRSEYQSFAEAEANAASRVEDGDDAWLNIKFKTKLGDYVRALPIPNSPGKFRYVLFTEIGPRGDVTALTQYTLVFSQADLAASELRFNLAPGLFGRNKSIPLLLKTADNAHPGVWQDEFRIANTSAIPRGQNGFLAKAPIVLDLAGSPTKYRQMWAEYKSVLLRGTPDTAKMPVLGRFVSPSVRGEVSAKLRSAGIVPAKVYFAGDDWSEVASSAFLLGDPTYSPKRARRVFATYTYQKFGACLYGVAEITQQLDPKSSSFLTSSIDLSNDFPIDCGLLK